MKLINKLGHAAPLENLSTYSSLAVYPGSFNPLHEGHRGIYQLLTREGFNVVFEISQTRYQKAPYSDSEFKFLIDQFKGFAELLVSDAPLFSQKRDQLSSFDPFWIMGYDTAERWIFENRKADTSEKDKIAKMKVIFVGRLTDGVYHDPRDLLTGDERYWYKIFHYKNDISSTQIRQKNIGHIK